MEKFLLEMCCSSVFYFFNEQKILNNEMIFNIVNIPIESGIIPFSVLYLKKQRNFELGRFYPMKNYFSKVFKLKSCVTQKLLSD